MPSDQICSREQNHTIELFYDWKLSISGLSHAVTTSQMWLLDSLSVANVTENWILDFT